MEPEWKLGEDMYEDDCIFDPITFRDIILMLHCNEKVIDAASARKCYFEILADRREEALYLLERNIDEIIRRAKIGRGGYEQEEKYES